MTRQYEWRYMLNGRPVSRPCLDENACTYYLRSVSSGQVVPWSSTIKELGSSASLSPNYVGLYVVNTGECVYIEYDSKALRARLLSRDEEPLPWIKMPR